MSTIPHEEGMITSESETQHISHLMALVGRNGCGPDSWQELVRDLHTAHRKAHKDKEVVNLSYASVFDILVFPNGTFVLVPSNLVRYRIPGAPECGTAPIQG